MTQQEPFGGAEVTPRVDPPPYDPQLHIPNPGRPFPAKHPGVLSTQRFTVTAAAPPTLQRVIVQRPTVLIPYLSSFPGASPANQLEITYLPGASVFPGNGNHGIVSMRGACYLWAPGEWGIALGPNGPNGETIEFVGIPTEDQRMVEQLMRPWEFGTRGAVREATVALAAATITTLLELDPVIFRDYIRVTNVGANPALIDWVAQTATSGQLLAPGASLEFFGKTLPMARLQGRSTVGTSIQVDTSQRNFNT